MRDRLLIFFFIVVEKYNIKFTILTFFSIHFSSVRYIHIVIQPMSATFLLCKTQA